MTDAAPEATNNAVEFLSRFQPEDFDREAFDDECNYFKPARSSNKAPAKCQNKAKFTDPRLLPTCKLHRLKVSAIAGRCQAPVNREGMLGQCSRLFRWTPPYFQLCQLHQESPFEPCYILKLPSELRMEIFRFMLPEGQVHSSRGDGGPRLHEYVPLLYVNRNFYTEAKNVLYSTVPFVIDVRASGIFMCSRWLLRPRDDTGHDVGYKFGTSTGWNDPNEDPQTMSVLAQSASDLFKASFPWSCVKNYIVRILYTHRDVVGNDGWSEEVEVFDIRDLVGLVAVLYLRRSKVLSSLTTEFSICSPPGAFNPPQIGTDRIFGTLNQITEPLMRCRGFRRATLRGVSYTSVPDSIEQRQGLILLSHFSSTPHNLFLLDTSNQAFVEYKKKWEVAICSDTAYPRRQPLRAWFSRFKMIYTELLSNDVISLRLKGEDCLLHKARVARELDDQAGFLEVLQYLTATFLHHKEEKEQSDLRLQAQNEARRDRFSLLETQLTLMLGRFNSAPELGPPTPLQRLHEELDRHNEQLVGLAEKLSASDRQTCLESLPPEGLAQMQEDWQRMNEKRQELEREAREVEHAWEQRWVVRALAMQQKALSKSEVSDGKSVEIIPLDSPSLPGVDSSLPTPPSSASSAPEKLANPWNDKSIAGPSALIQRSRAVECVDETPNYPSPEQDSRDSYVLPNYAGKGKARIDAPIVIIDDD